MGCRSTKNRPVGYSHHLTFRLFKNINHHSSRTPSHNHLILVPSWAELGVAGEIRISADGADGGVRFRPASAHVGHAVLWMALPRGIRLSRPTSRLQRRQPRRGVGRSRSLAIRCPRKGTRRGRGPSLNLPRSDPPRMLYDARGGFAGWAVPPSP